MVEDVTGHPFEQAAAGLWTTPTDLLTLSSHLLRILEDDVGDGVVSPATLRTMLEAHRGDEDGFERYGLVRTRGLERGIQGAVGRVPRAG